MRLVLGRAEGAGPCSSGGPAQSLSTAALADRFDWEWFVAHPERQFHVRRSIPNEQPQWGPDGHLKEPYMLTIMRGDEQEILRVPFFAKAMPADDEAFLKDVWAQMTARARTMKRPGTIRF